MASVLIISYSMPPSNDIGGRRWVKFAKILKRRGHLVKIIAANEIARGSSWDADSKELEGDIYFTNSLYPQVLSTQPLSLLQKVQYRLALLYVKFLHKGNYYDKSNHWQGALLKTGRHLLRKYSITNVICTVPPFRAAAFLVSLKREFPSINYILDFRDPWTNNQTSFGFTGLSPQRLAFETSLEKASVNAADHIIIVSQGMGNHFAALDLGTKKKLVVIPNGYDDEEYEKKPPSRNEENSELRIVFAGTFYDKAIHVFKELALAVEKYQLDHPDEKGNVRFTFIGSLPQQVRQYVDAHQPVFRFAGRQSHENTRKEVYNADFCALFLTDDLDHSFSTKFYEYLAAGKKILSFARFKGANARYIEQHGLGYAADFAGMHQLVQRLFKEGKKMAAIPYNDDFDTRQFSVSELTSKVEKLLI